MYYNRNTIAVLVKSMKRSKRTKEEKKSFFRRLSFEGHIKPETKKSVVAVLLFGCAVLLILASLGKAGPAGDLTFRSFTTLFGIGYYLLPATLLLVALLFFATREERFMGTTILSAAGAIVFGLGLIDILFPEEGGIIGRGVGALEVPFGKTAAIVITVTFIVTLVLIAGNASLRFKKRAATEEPDATESRELDAEEVEDLVAKLPEPEEAEERRGDAERERKKNGKKEDEPIIAAAHKEPLAIAAKATAIKAKDYVAPSLSLLKSTIEKPTAGDLRANANIIKRTLESFGIPVDMGEINIGPKVTRYTLKPAEGMKLSRIEALHKDLSLALAAHPIRIEAPIPGKSLVGIEVPNKAAALVRLGSLMSYPEFQASGPLGFALGRDVTGDPLFADIERMPHLLVAGATGSGKSILMHSPIVSLLYKNSPASLKLILIDPKRVELTMYSGLPHLALPVITQSKKAIAVFRWAISEMERRYELLSASGRRDIQSYNKKADEPLPYILVVVDELADLMTSYGREVEGSIIRLAQMARATG